MLNKYYANNGRVFETLEEAGKFLHSKKYFPYRGVFRNKDKIARLYRLKNAVINIRRDEITHFKVDGYLVSFGGVPIGRDGHKLVKLKASDY